MATEAERARLFVALELPPATREELSGWSRARVGGVEAARPVRPESLHVTLCFLGQRPVSDVPGIAAASRTAVAGSPAPRLRVQDVLLLPPRRPRVLALALAEIDGDRLARAQAALAGALVHAGYYAPERRRFLAHVTVARVVARLPRSLDLSPPDPAPFAGDRVTLFRSRLGSGPARYEPLDTVVLAG